MSFSDDLKKFQVKTDAKAHVAVKAIVVAVDQSLVEKSPVGNAELWKRPENKPPGYVGGRFRANWQYGDNEIPDSELFEPNAGRYPGAEESIEGVAAKIAPDAAGKKHYLVNNLPYAKRLEEDGWSTQAPVGMVGLTVIEFQGIVGAAVKNVKEGK